MNLKLEPKYVAFIRDLSERRKPAGTSGLALVMGQLIDKAKALHEELMQQGYGK